MAGTLAPPAKHSVFSAGACQPAVSDKAASGLGEIVVGHKLADHVGQVEREANVGEWLLLGDPSGLDIQPQHLQRIEGQVHDEHGHKRHHHHESNRGRCPQHKVFCPGDVEAALLAQDGQAHGSGMHFGIGEK